MLGQNVDSYLWYGGGLKKDFNKANDKEKADSINFAKLLRIVAEECPELRIRVSTANRQDMTEEVIKTMKSYLTFATTYIYPFNQEVIRF